MRSGVSASSKLSIKNNMRSNFFYLIFIIIYVITMHYELRKNDVSKIWIEQHDPLISSVIS